MAVWAVVASDKSPIATFIENSGSEDMNGKTKLEEHVKTRRKHGLFNKSTGTRVHPLWGKNRALEKYRERAWIVHAMLESSNAITVWQEIWNARIRI